jgi:hypothetical protein
MRYKEKRQHQRNLVTTEVAVNDGTPYRGGVLFDMSVGGAAITYPSINSPSSEPITVGQFMVLTLNDRAKMPGRVARVFENGFAAEFDFSS